MPSFSKRLRAAEVVLLALPRVEKDGLEFEKALLSGCEVLKLGREPRECDEEWVGRPGSGGTARSCAAGVDESDRGATWSAASSCSDVASN
jgi:hypothetical protein